MQPPLISVVVPAYNVAGYLPRCLDSLVGQSYTPLEIIVINDGSTDATESVICNYQATYTQIRMLSQEKAGASAARNAGLHTARGEYIAFVDADDYVSFDYVAYLYERLRRCDADIATCRSWQIYREKHPVREKSPEKIQVCSGFGALEKALYRTDIQAVSWGKLFKRSVVQDLSFPVGVQYAEDFAFVTKALANCKKVVLSSRCLYYYQQRSGSICHTADPRKRSALDMGLQGERFVASQCPQILPAAKSRTFVYAVQILRDLPYRGKACQNDLQYASELIRQRRKVVLFDAKNKPWIRLLALIACLHPKLAGEAGKAYTWFKNNAKLRIRF